MAWGPARVGGWQRPWPQTLGAGAAGRSPQVPCRVQTAHPRSGGLDGYHRPRAAVRARVGSPARRTTAKTSGRRPMSDAAGAQAPYNQFPITTALEFPEWSIERSLGMVFGVVVRSMGAARGFTAGFRALAGGEVKQYTKLVEDSRRHALDRMIENAPDPGSQRGGLVPVRLLRGRPVPDRDRRLRHRRRRRRPAVRTVGPGGARVAGVVILVLVGAAVSGRGDDQLLRPSPRRVRCARSRLDPDRRGLPRPGDRPDDAGLARPGRRPALRARTAALRPPPPDGVTTSSRPCRPSHPCRRPWRRQRPRRQPDRPSRACRRRAPRW